MRVTVALNAPEARGTRQLPIAALIAGAAFAVLGSLWVNWRETQWTKASNVSLAGGTTMMAAELGAWSARVAELRELAAALVSDLPSLPTSELLSAALLAAPNRPAAICVGALDEAGRWQRPPMRVARGRRGPEREASMTIAATLTCPVEILRDQDVALDTTVGGGIVARTNSIVLRSGGQRVGVAVAARLDDPMRPAPSADASRIERVLILFWRDGTPYVFSEQGNMPSVIDLGAPPRIRSELREAVEALPRDRPNASFSTGLEGEADMLISSHPIPALGALLVREVRAADRARAVRRAAWLEATAVNALLILMTFALLQWRRAKRSERDRDRAMFRATFAAQMSHEFRTPLAQIRLFGELLQSGSLPLGESSSRALGVITKEARRLALMVDNMLTFASNQGEPPRSTARVALGPEVVRAVDAFAPLAAERESSVNTSIEVADSMVVGMDEDALRQILNNLLDNAVKHGPPRQRVSVGVFTDGTQGIVVVDDEGPGIPANDRARVFEPFIRLDDATQRSVPGSGLGLAVVRQLADAAGAKVELGVSSSGGARVTLRIPLADAARSNA